jgi:hypothetical protein
MKGLGEMAEESERSDGYKSYAKERDQIARRAIIEGWSREKITAAYEELDKRFLFKGPRVIRVERNDGPPIGAPMITERKGAEANPPAKDVPNTDRQERAADEFERMFADEDNDEDDDDSEPFDWQAAWRARGFGTRPEEQRYAWDSPVGKMIILASPDSTGRWRLMIDYKVVGEFADHVAAMEAVLKRRTGWAEWDKYDGPDKPPEDDRDWSASPY